MRSVTNVTPFFILNKKNDIFYEIIHPIFLYLLSAAIMEGEMAAL